MELALYGPGGFYTAAGGAGRRRDFLTSPEVGPLFGAVIGRALDRWWAELGRPDPFVVVDAGAGPGTLAAAVLAARPECSTALHYVLVERSDALREEHQRRLPLEPARQLLGPVLAGRGDEDGEPAPGTGPVVSSLARLPGAAVTGVLIANELLDNLPFRLLERGRGSWHEVRVGEEGGRLVEVVLPAPDDAARAGDRYAPDAPAGARVPFQQAARAWLRDALALLRRGRVVVVDYADTTASLAQRPWGTWLRTYRAHGPGGHPLEHPGEQDVTCEVAVDQLVPVRRPAAERSQAAFLADHGIGSLVDAARDAWRERAHLGDLEAVRARSRVNEAAALMDPAGLGGFRVIEWAVP